MLSTLDLKSTYEAQGYAVARHLFPPEEVALLHEHYMRLRAQGPHLGDLVKALAILMLWRSLGEGERI